MRILIATKNPGKAREIAKFLGVLTDRGIKIISLGDFPDVPNIEETGKTFEENAVLKARKYFEWSGMPTVADDSGLEIDYLNGEPGVKSRRWLGYEMTDREMIDTALEKLKGVPKEKRTAHLTAVGAYYDGKNTIIENGSIDGYITEKQTVKCEPGYPFRAIFMVPEFSAKGGSAFGGNKLYQNLTHEEHEQINHRKVVYRSLAKKILELENK